MELSDKAHELREQLKFPPYEGFPDIELYMDQVLDFLSRSRTSLRDDDRLSSAMVNNYIKAELLPRARGKKYSREHLVHLAIILRLKQVLSVKDTGRLLSAYREGKTDEVFFDSFRDMVDESAKEICEGIAAADADLADLAMSLAVSSYISKVGCEYILDRIMDGHDENEGTNDFGKTHDDESK
ncbi:MAG: DUF1836 domain-containing protein [Clostridiales bacterium]|nr:DUF1836 domain-containing protein [Clostridiales bacterium]